MRVAMRSARGDLAPSVVAVAWRCRFAIEVTRQGGIVTATGAVIAVSTPI
jgi:hypothetical protein